MPSEPETYVLQPGVTLTVAGAQIELVEPAEVHARPKRQRMGTRKRQATTARVECPSGCEVGQGERYAVRIGLKTLEQIGAPLCPQCTTTLERGQQDTSGDDHD